MFDIEPVVDPKTKQEIGTALLEKQTASRFRFVTADECLTNSFWNFYLKFEEDNNVGEDEDVRGK